MMASENRKSVSLGEVLTNVTRQGHILLDIRHKTHSGHGRYPIGNAVPGAIL